LAPGRLLAQLAQRLSAHALGCAGALAAMLAVRQWGVVAPVRLGMDGWTTAQAGLASAAAIALGAALPALAVVAATRAFFVAAPSSGAGEGGSLRSPLLAPQADAGQGGASLPRVRFVADAAADGAGAVAVVAASGDAADDKDGGGGKSARSPALELPVALGRPTFLRGLVCDWLAAHNHAGQSPQDGKASRNPPPAELYAMGPEALVAEARMLVDDLAALGGGAGAGAGGAEGASNALPAVLFRLRTHEL
jgi:hypothetical protein